jgi:hypothetical protein
MRRRAPPPGRVTGRHGPARGHDGAQRGDETFSGAKRSQGHDGSLRGLERHRGAPATSARALGDVEGATMDRQGLVPRSNPVRFVVVPGLGLADPGRTRPSAMPIQTHRTHMSEIRFK